jgi:hypothetical protein
MADSPWPVFHAEELAADRTGDGAATLTGRIGAGGAGA